MVTASARTLLLLALIAAARISLAAPPAPPRPLGEAERYAAQLAVDYLEKGPAAWWDALSPRSPLRDLGRKDAIAEIEVRAGSPEGARWELRTTPVVFPANRAIFSIEHPTGLDQALVVSLVEEGSGYRLQSIRSLAEPIFREKGEKPAPGPDPALLAHRKRLALGSGGFAFSALAFALIVPLRRRLGWAAIVCLAGLAGAGFGARELGLARSELDRTPVGTRVERVQRLSSLAGLRARMEKGETVTASAGDPASTIVAKLWQAQLAMQRSSLDEARTLLTGIPEADEVPWADVLRGRLGFLAKSEAESVAGYQRVIDWGVYHDGLLTEALAAFTILGYPTGRDWSLEKLLAMGSRSADSHYLDALCLVLTRAPREDIEKAFVQGWELRPLERRSLLRMGGAFWPLLRSPGLYSRLGLDTPSADSMRVPPTTTPSPLVLPPGATPHLSTTYFRAVFPSGAELAVSGAAHLAGPTVAQEDAGAEGREREAKSLAELEKLQGRLTSLGALAQPALRTELTRVCRALEARHRFRELATLTAGFTGSEEQVPPRILLQRAEALRRTNRAEMARKVLAAFEKNAVLDRQPDPALLRDLAEQLSAGGDLDGAIRCLERALKVKGSPYLLERLSRLRSEQSLAAGFATVSRGRFDVHYPSKFSADVPGEIGRILTAEWTRMEPSIPSVKGRSVIVELLAFADFQKTFGTALLGLYDGKIRLPLVGVTRFTPPIVGLMSHELAHAMIADATEDFAPHWLHEGLAQRLAMQAQRENPMENLKRDGLLLSLPAIEEVLQSFPDDDLVVAAYRQSEWMVLFIEKRFGKKSVPDLLAAFEKGRSTEEAVREALGVSVPELDERFREWALTEAPKEIKDPKVIRYD